MPDQDKDILYMERAFELAKKGKGTVQPNPMVGCVIVREDEIIGEGWHRQYGGDHAEVEAIKSITDKSLLQSSTLYVNLEPCSFQGNTPPCANMLAQYPIERVVISNTDPNPKVSGSGLKILRDAGIQITEEVMEVEGNFLNRRFFTYHKQNRPYVILKWAQTSDGFIARDNFDSKWISSVESRKIVHKWRSEEQAIMVGANTVQHDNPQLTVRDWEGNNPIRIVIDPNLRIDRESKIFDNEAPTLIYNQLKSEESDGLTIVKIDEENFLKGILNDLYSRKILSIFVEGGSKLLTSFIEANLWDETRVFESKTTFGSGIKAPDINRPADYEETHSDDLLFTYLNQR